MNINSHNLYYTAPANEWVEALPIGNGKTGAMVFGGTDKDTLSLNYDELWSGHPEDMSKPEAYKIFEKARELVFANKNREAQDLLEQEFNNRSSNAYLPFGDMIIRHDAGEITDYYRKLDISKAVAFCSYRLNGNKITKTYITSFPDNCLAVRITAEKPVLFNVTLNSPLKNTTFVEDGLLILDGTCFSNSLCIKNQRPEKYPELYSDKDDEHGIDFRGAVKITSDGTVFTSESGLAVRGTDISVYFACESSYNGFDKSPYLEGKPYKNVPTEIVSKASVKGFEKIYSDHIADFAQYYDRVKLDISGDNDVLVPTVDRFTNLLDGKEDKSMYELLFNFGRYLTISSSRPGSQATNLQGIWNFTIDPPWQSNYTININTEMNYYPALSCNLAEFQEPLDRFVTELSVAGEKTAKEFYNARGFCSHHNSDLWRLTSPVPGNSCWSFWPMSGGWFCHNLFDKYEYTQDEAYLRNTVLPVLKKSAEFYLDTMVEDKDGYLILAPSTSPENSFIIDGKECAVALTSTMTMSIIRDVFNNFIKSCDILGITDEDYEAVKEALPKLLPFRTGSQGQLLEWYEEYKEAEVHHRHCSHLYALYPSHLINPITEPKLTEAVKKTLEIRGDDGTGWSLGWKICFWARLMDGDHALKLINMQLRPVKTYRPRYGAGGGTYPNMFDAHPPFQIDGNFGAAAGIAEMLVQRIDNKIYLLPALPTSWSEGSVTGLKVRGNITVNINWKNGSVTDYTLEGNTAGIEVVKP